jgi:hypothetical protein
VSAPNGWDERSWFDTCNAEQELRALLDRLRGLMANNPSADLVASLFEDVERVASVGGLAASWSKE